MRFCTYCARQIAVGEECTCPAAVEAANLARQDGAAMQGQHFEQNIQDQQGQDVQHDSNNQAGAYEQAESYGQATPYSQAEPYGQPPHTQAEPYAQPPQYTQPPPYGQPPPYAQPTAYAKPAAYAGYYGQPSPYAPYGQQGFYGQPGGGYPLPMPYMRYIQPGRGMLKVSSIIMTAIAGLSVIFWIISALNYFYCCGFRFEEHGVRMIVTVLALAFGITGIILSPNPRRGFIILGFGASLLVYNIVTFAFVITNGGHFSSGPLLGYSIAEIITFTALSVLFIVGGVIRARSRMYQVHAAI